MITTDATPGFRHIHSRMPVMLEQDMLHQWLNPEIDGRSLMACLMPNLPGPLQAVPVDARINSSRVKEKPEPIAAEERIE